VDCFHYKKSQKNASAESGKSSETAKIEIQKDHVTFNVREKDQAVDSGMWYIDSSVTNHMNEMTNDHSFLSWMKLKLQFPCRRFL